MASLHVQQRIDAPAERVFALATDIAGAAERIAGIEAIEVLTELPFGRGFRWRETRREMGRTATEELTIAAVEPPVSYTSECESCGCRFVTRFRVEESGGASLASFEVTSRPLTLAARLLSPLAGVVAATVKKAIARDLVDLKAAAEAGE